MPNETASKDNAGWYIEETIDGSWVGTKTITFKTENKFCDADARAVITTPAASAPTFSLSNNNSGSLTWGTPSAGYYYPTATLTGTASIATAGWSNVTDSPAEKTVTVAQVAQSIMAKDSVTTSNQESISVDPSASSQVVTVSSGYNSVNKTITINAATPAASPTLALTDKTTSLSMGTASNGVYSPTITLTGNVNIASAGWITAGNHAVSDESVTIGTVNQSTMLNGQSPVASGSTVTPGPSEQTITITEGYNAARTLVIGSASSSSPGSVTSGSATISSLTFTYNSSEGEFNITGTADVSAPTVGTAGYVSGSVGTLNANTGGATVSTVVDEISLGVALSGATTARKPTLSKQSISISGVTDAANGSATATAPSSGAYVAVRSAANTETITATPSVYSAGYGTTSNYNVNANATATVGAAQSDIYYVPIKAGTVTSGTASITSTSIAYNSTSGKFDITGSANVSAPTFTEGYIATNVGTKSGKTNGATLSDELDKIAIGASISGTGTFTPSIVKHSNTNITTAGSATTSQPASGYYVAVNSVASTGTVTATPSVTTAGYGTTTSGQYTATTDTLTVGASASSTTYIPIGSATLANTATSGTTYTDTSSTAPVLISGSYLFINEGYISNQKISLAQLVPDGASASLSGDYILSGYSAYDSDGALVAGSIQTYDGSYTIT